MLSTKKNILLLLFCVFYALSAIAADPLPSWNEGTTKQRIIDFVGKVSKKDSKDYVEPVQRIAVFDNDGTLWPEQPVYFQLAFALDRVKALSKDHPEWKTKQPFKAVLENDLKTLEKLGEKGLLEILAATHSGMSTKDFEKIANDWAQTATHPRFKQKYTDLTYQPMLELLSYLRDNQFRTFIVSGGGIEFMRAWAPKAYGIPPEQIVGSSTKVKYELIDGKPVLKRLPEILFIDDKEGKPAGINLFIGQQPIMAFGNSDGDIQMLEWTTLNTDKPSLAMIVHHDDAKREWAYDKDSPIGKLDKGLDKAKKNNWTLISIKDDWNTIFPFEKSASKKD